MKGQQRPPSAGGCSLASASIPSAAGGASSVPSIWGIPDQVGKMRAHVGVSRWVGAQGSGMSLQMEKGTPALQGSGCSLPRVGQREGWGADPWLDVSMANAELRAGKELCARHPSHMGNLALQGLRGSYPASAQAEGCQMHQTGWNSSCGAECPSSTGRLCCRWPAQGLRLGLLSSHLSTMEQPS